jgi:hypothetical protein
VYQEGSSYSGYLATDVVHLGAGGACAALRIAFGCATVESGHFRFQQADGIMGLASSRHLSSLEAAAEMSGGSGRGRPPRQGALVSATDAESDGDGRSLLRLLSGGGRADGGQHGIAMASSSTRKATAAASSTGEPSQQHRGVHRSTGEPSQQHRGVHSSTGETDTALDSSVDRMLTAARSPTVLEALVAQGLVADGFSLCIGRGTGHLSFGLPRAWQAGRRGAVGTADEGALLNGSTIPLNGRTTPGSQHDASPRPLRPLGPPPFARLEPMWARAESGAYYSVGVRGLRYGDRPIGSRPTSTIIDSGTTFMCACPRPLIETDDLPCMHVLTTAPRPHRYMHSAAFRPFLDALRDALAACEGFGEAIAPADEFCVRRSARLQSGSEASTRLQSGSEASARLQSGSEASGAKPSDEVTGTARDRSVHGSGSSSDSSSDSSSGSSSGSSSSSPADAAATEEESEARRLQQEQEMEAHRQLDRCFAPIRVDLADGGTLSMSPSTYFYAGERTGEWCAGVFDNYEDGMVLGTVNLIDRLVMFDREQGRVGFASTDCDRFDPSSQEEEAADVGQGAAAHAHTHSTSHTEPAIAASAASTASALPSRRILKPTGVPGSTVSSLGCTTGAGRLVAGAALHGGLSDQLDPEHPIGASASLSLMGCSSCLSRPAGTPPGLLLLLLVLVLAAAALAAALAALQWSCRRRGVSFQIRTRRSWMPNLERGSRLHSWWRHVPATAPSLAWLPPVHGRRHGAVEGEPQCLDLSTGLEQPSMEELYGLDEEEEEEDAGSVAGSDHCLLSEAERGPHGKGGWEQ